MDLNIIYELLTAKSKQNLQDGIVKLIVNQAKIDLEGSDYFLVYPGDHWNKILESIENDCEPKLRKLFSKDLFEVAKTRLEEAKNGKY